jgi:hypothetical protein
MLNLQLHEMRMHQDPHLKDEEEEEDHVDVAAILPVEKVILQEMIHQIPSALGVDILQEEEEDLDVLQITLLMPPSITTTTTTMAVINKITRDLLADLIVAIITINQMLPDNPPAPTEFHQPQHCLSLICHINSPMMNW